MRRRTGFNLSTIAITTGLAVLLGAAPGCQSLNEPIYIAAPAAIEAGNDMMAAGPATTNPTRVKGTIVVRFRRPTAAEQRSLDDQTAKLGGTRVPWLRRDRIHLELLYTVENKTDQDGTFTVGVDGASELVKYDEDAIAAVFTAANEKPVLLPLMAPTPRALGAHQVFQGTLREDDFIEGSLDLDAMGRWMAPFAAVLINRSDVNPVGLDMVPPDLIVPALQEIDVTLASETLMHCEFMVRVRDDDDQLLHDAGDANLFAPAPVVFAPTLPPP